MVSRWTYDDTRPNRPYPGDTPDGSGELLLIPGPTPVPPDVQEAAAKPVVPHRGPESTALYGDLTRRLTAIFGTEGKTAIMPCSGTGAVEAVMINTLSPGDRVLACVMGLFGVRFANQAEALGLEVHRLNTPWGRVPSTDEIIDALSRDDYKAILLVHCETSAGTVLPLEEVGPAVRRESPETLVLADMVSSFGGMEVKLDEWGIDGAATASQKALMCPPGLGITAFGPRGLEAMEHSRFNKFAWDARPYMEDPPNLPYTPALTLWYALDAALARIEEEGPAAVYRRHREMGTQVRRGLTSIGLKPLAPEERAAPTVTAADLPDGVDPHRLLEIIREQYGIILASGLGPLSSHTIRVGHMGAVTPQHLDSALEALEAVLKGPDLPSL